MPSEVESVKSRAWRGILLGTLAVGVLDALDAILFFGLRGVTPGRIFQGIASGLLGKASFSGGPATVTLGVAIHFFIAFSIASVYALASRRWPALTRRPVVFGIPYGLAVYAVMNLIVIPLSAINPPPPSVPRLVNGLLIHMFGVGIPSALAARWGRRST